MLAGTDAAPEPVHYLYPKDRFEWERIVRRVNLPLATKGVGMILAQYGNSKGKSIHPGVDRLARVCRKDERTVRRHLKALRDYGLIRVVKSGGIRHARRMADEYELTYPSNLVDLPDLLTPNEQVPDAD